MLVLEPPTNNLEPRDHTWIKNPCTCNHDGTCHTCTFGIAGCTVCGLDNQRTRTTECSGESLEANGPLTLIRSLIKIAGLDFIDGDWTWRSEGAANLRGGIRHIYRTPGSIDNLVVYAESRLTRMARSGY